jgi:hypothetical protein
MHASTSTMHMNTVGTQPSTGVPAPKPVTSLTACMWVSLTLRNNTAAPFLSWKNLAMSRAVSCTSLTKATYVPNFFSVKDRACAMHTRQISQGYF